MTMKWLCRHTPDYENSIPAANTKGTKYRPIGQAIVLRLGLSNNLAAVQGIIAWTPGAREPEEICLEMII
jgi:hypothetical protein